MRFIEIGAVLLLAHACANTPPLPNKPPTDREQQLEGVKALSKCGELPEEKRVRVSARLAETDKGPALHFTFTNTSGKPLRLYRFQLPWGNANAIELAAVATNGEIPAVFWPIDDPRPEEPLVLAPW